MSIYYASEKLTLAVSGMACSPAPLPRRLADAAVYHLIHIRSADLPDDLRFRFDEIMAAFDTTEPRGDEGRIAASAAVMTDEQAQDVARNIVYVYDAVKSRVRHKEDADFAG